MVSNKEEKDAIVIENGSFGWDHDSPNVLEEINIRIKPGSLTAVSKII